MKIFFKDTETNIEVGINDDGDLYIGDDQIGYNLKNTPENRRMLEKDYKRFTGKEIKL